MSHLALLNAAEKAARAGADALKAFMPAQSDLQVETKALNDFVTAADLRAQEAIHAVITKAFPSHDILGEEENPRLGARANENALADSSRQNPCWVIDPLDGTTNFIHGYPVFAVSVACVVAGRTRAGVVIDPSRNEVFRAAAGHGAYLGDRKLSVSSRTSLEAALIATGFPFRRQHRIEEFLGTFREVFARVAGIRRAGSAALDLAQVACGRFDGFWEEGLGPWDIAAGSLLIEEAGGRVGDFLGHTDYLQTGAIIAAPPPIFEELQPIVHHHQGTP